MKSQGRILQVKGGYNPNSSSVGSGIPPFLIGMIGAGAVSVLVANLVNPVRQLIRRKRLAAETQQDDQRE